MAAVAPGAADLFELRGSWETVQAYFDERGWTDGLPIVPPTRRRVAAMLRGCDRDPHELIARLPPRDGEATAERLAINAVMAGCLPSYLPVLIAAVQAVANPAFNLTSIQSTTHPTAILILVNGPLGQSLGLNYGSNCFGQGRRANATIGRALRLVLINVGGGSPGAGDKATQGTPAKYSFCAAEHEAANPWQPFHVEKGFDPDDSVVTVLACEGPHNINDHTSIGGLGLLTTAAHSMRVPGSNNMRSHGGEPLVAFGEEHAAQIARDGYTKDDVKQFLWEHSKLSVVETSAEWQAGEWVDRLRADTGQSEWTPIARHWSDINVIVAGGPGKHSSWMPTFGHRTKVVMQRIERADGRPLHESARR